MVPVRMNLDFGNLSNGKTNSMITCKSLETRKLFDDTVRSAIFHSHLLSLLEFRAIFHRSSLFLENRVTALHVFTFPDSQCYSGAWKYDSFPGAASQPASCQSNQWSCIAGPYCVVLFRGFTGGQKNEDVKQEKDDVLNIFSVASGHLYERFLRLVQNL